MADDASMMAVACPACGQRMRVPAAAKGKTCKCVKCGERIALDDVTMAEMSETPSAGDQAADKPEEAPDVQPDHIGQLLIEAGLITPEQLDEALALQKKQGGKTFELLISLGYLDKDNLHGMLSRQPGVASIDIKNYEIGEELLEYVPKQLAEQHLVLPIDKMGKLLTVGMACPLDSVTIAKIQEKSGLRVKAMLCRLDDIQAAVQKYYTDDTKGKAADFSFITGVSGAAKKDDVQSQLERLDPLPARNDVASRAIKLAQDPNAPVRELVDTIQSDPALAAWVLSVGNSAAYGLSQQVYSVALAATLMGRDALGRVVANAETVEPSANGAPNAESIRARALFSTIAAPAIANACGKGRPGAAASAGLLHELGRVVLAKIKKDRYLKVEASLFGAELARAEDQAIGIAHPEAGYIVVTAWGLPPAVAEPIRHYLRPEKAEESCRDTAYAVALASVLGLAGVPDGPLNEQDALSQAADYLAYLNLDKQTAANILAKTAAAVKARL